MTIGYLILCHSDPDLAVRVARKLAASPEGNFVFIHVDEKSSCQAAIVDGVADLSNVQVLSERYNVSWGAPSAIDATYALLRAAYSVRSVDRFVLLQGADYPIKSSSYISEFFTNNEEVEYLRGCNCSDSTKKYLYSKARHSLLYEKLDFFKKVRNKIIRIMDIKSKSKYINVEGRNWSVYWGCAQFAVTRKCVELFLHFEKNEVLRAHFRDIFPADETFFHTILYNSNLSSKTQFGGPEDGGGINQLTDLKNLTYFEYPKFVTVFEADDFMTLCELDYLFIRKVRSGSSRELLDRIDLQG